MKKKKWDGKGQGTPLGHKIFIAIINTVGILPAYLMLFPACIKYAFFDKKTARAVISFRNNAHLRVGFFSVYRHVYAFGMSLVDKFAFLLMKNPPFRYTCIHEDYIVKALSDKKGVILLSAHIGNWELAGNLLKDRIQAPINTVVVDAEKEELQEATREATEKRRVNLLRVTNNGVDTVVEIMAALKRGEIVALLGDRILDQKSRKIEFLGKPAPFPTGPFAIAAATGAPIIPVFVMKTGLLNYTFEASPPIQITFESRKDRDARILEAMEKYVAICEKTARAYPLQWFNFYDFWEE